MSLGMVERVPKVTNRIRAGYQRITVVVSTWPQSWIPKPKPRVQNGKEAKKKDPFSRNLFFLFPCNTYSPSTWQLTTHGVFFFLSGGLTRQPRMMNY